MSRELSPQEEKLIDERYAHFRKSHGELREERRRRAVHSLNRLGIATGEEDDHCGLRLQRRAGESMKNVQKVENPGTLQPK